jgi:hypothetical protein
MPELHSNGSYDPYIAQMFNPLVGGAWGTLGAGAIPGLAAQPQSPLGAQTPWAYQNGVGQNPLGQTPLGALNPLVQQGPNPVQSLVAIQVAQQIVAKQAAHAFQCAQALQAILQQALSQLAAPQAQFGAGQFGPGQIGPGQIGPGQIGLGQFGQGQPLQQLMQYLAMQQPAPFRYGLAA